MVEKPWCHDVEPRKKRKAHVVGQKRTTKNMSDTGYKCSSNIEHDIALHYVALNFAIKYLHYIYIVSIFYVNMGVCENGVTPIPRAHHDFPD